MALTCRSVCALFLCMVASALAQSPAAANCCTITAIDLRTGVVTAEDGATKRQHRILMNNAVLVRRLALGQSVDIDVRAGKAIIEGIDGRFALVEEAVDAVDVIVGRDGNRHVGTLQSCSPASCQLSERMWPREAIAWVGLARNASDRPPSARSSEKDEVHLVDATVRAAKVSSVTSAEVRTVEGTFARTKVAWIHFPPRLEEVPVAGAFGAPSGAPGTPQPPAPPETPQPPRPPRGGDGAPAPPPPPPPTAGRQSGALWTGTIRGREWGTRGDTTTERLITVDVRLRETAPIRFPSYTQVFLDPVGSTITTKETSSSRDVSCSGGGTTTAPGMAGKQGSYLMTKTRNSDTRQLAAGIDIPLGRTLYFIGFFGIDDYTNECRGYGATWSNKGNSHSPFIGRTPAAIGIEVGDPEIRFLQGPGTMVGSYQAPSILAGITMASAEWSICRAGVKCPPLPDVARPPVVGKPPPSKEEDPCGDLAAERALVDVIWQQRQAYVRPMEAEWNRLKQAHDEMLDNVEAYRAAIDFCAISDIVTETLESAGGWAGEFTEFVTKILSGDLSASVGAEPWKSLAERASASFPRESSWAGNMRSHLGQCTSPLVSPELKSAALRFVDRREQVRQLMPSVQEGINRVRDLDQRYWDQWQRFHQVCLTRARCKGIPATSCPAPPSEPRGPMPGSPG